MELNNQNTIDLKDLLQPIKHDSIFEKRKLNDMFREIQEVYKGDNRPWVIGYSGGKDSTSVLQLIWMALAKLPKDELKKPIYVISSNTLVETPVVANHVLKSIEKISKAGEKEKLPFKGVIVEPKTSQSFWVNVLGRGYPAPSREFRWCTDRMKIKPANRFIKDQIEDHGEIIMILGVRKSESMTRAQVMEYQKSRKTGELFSAHSTIPGALVYTPIEEWSVDDVWFFLLQYKSPWGGNNHNLSAMYQKASGECPVVIDTSTPSCGNSRFGCWTCTVVKKDVALESMIEQGDRWMEPMLDIRDKLKETQTQSMKIKTRSHKRRDGKITLKNLKRKDGSGKRDLDRKSIVFGPYTMDFRKELLKELLIAEEKVLNEAPKEVRKDEIHLITMDELKEIRRMWLFEEMDWEDSLPTIYSKVKLTPFPLEKDDIGNFTSTDYEVLKEVATEKEGNLELVMRLLDIERATYGMIKRPKIHKKIKKILHMDYISRDQAFLEIYGASEAEIINQLEEEE